MKTTLKKLGWLVFCTSIMAVCCGGWTVEVREEVASNVISATLPPLQQCVPMADGGFPTPAFCTMYNNNNNAIRAATNTVSAAQAPELLPKNGGVMTGHLRADNVGVVIGTNTAGVTGAANAVVYQTIDAGLISANTLGNDYRVQTNLAGAQYMRVQNASDGGLDSGNVMHMVVQGSVAQGIPANGYYFQTVVAGADSGYGDAATFSAESPHTTYHPHSMYFIANGAFAGTEVVTLRLMAYDDNDAGVDITPSPITFDGGNTSSEYDGWNLWYVIAASLATKSDSFQRFNLQRLVFDAMSDAGTTVVQIDVVMAATQN